MNKDKDISLHFGVWGVAPTAEVITQVQADLTVSAMSILEVRMLLAETQRSFDWREGFNPLAPDRYRCQLEYQCDQCRYEWTDYWTCPVDGDCPRCGMTHLAALPDSRAIARQNCPSGSTWT